MSFSDLDVTETVLHFCEVPLKISSACIVNFVAISFTETMKKSMAFKRSRIKENSFKMIFKNKAFFYHLLKVIPDFLFNKYETILFSEVSGNKAEIGPGCDFS